MVCLPGDGGKPGWRGSCMCLEQGAILEEHTSASEPVEGFRVLIVDDEDLIRWSLKEGLSARGHTVIEADRGRAALEGCLNGVDLALLEFRLPDTDGLELAAVIRRSNPACRVILMTAHGSSELTQQAAERDVFRVVDKPFDVTEVLDLVERALHATAS